MNDVLVTGSTGIGGAVAAALRERALTVGRGGMIRADLGLMSETARAADEVAARRTPLTAIVCCAGVFSLRAAHTPEGMERAFALNYLSRYLLVRRLLPLLKPGGRVVLVANAGRYRDTLGPMDDLNLHHGHLCERLDRGSPHPGSPDRGAPDSRGPHISGRGVRRGDRGLRVAGRTQFACDLFAVELALREPGLSVSCVFPGLVATRVFRDAPGVPAPLRYLLDAVQRRVGADPARAAATPVALAAGASAPSPSTAAPSPSPAEWSPGTAAPLPGAAAPLPGRAAPLPGRAAPLPGRAAPLPGRAAPLANPAEPLPGTAAPPPEPAAAVSAARFYSPGGVPIPVPERVLSGRRRELWEASEALVERWL
ncbi:hypothetical protein [Paractinoplanes lichenicola]|uniref:Uncharacterized protein n=1 Tax=Paractinoplanes lichenicola TaxID=2802976 RepID=A0ABS1VLF1_9ACTN|nr:hypothetical protein [Actinoplanes lichenicola]MBL7255321.1 hypothetical protein [Actinoplanes lichenicola]